MKGPHTICITNDIEGTRTLKTITTSRIHWAFGVICLGGFAMIHRRNSQKAHEPEVEAYFHYG